jgi:hypothetical protein
MNGLKPNINGTHQNKADDTSMMEVILKNTVNDTKHNNGQYGSNTNITSPINGGLPGVRGRTRVSTGSKLNLYIYLCNCKKLVQIKNKKSLQDINQF